MCTNGRLSAPVACMTASWIFCHGVDGETAAHSPSGSDVDRQETHDMAAQIGVVPLQAQPAMSTTAPAMSPPPTVMVWHSRAVRSQAKPLGHGRALSQ